LIRPGFDLGPVGLDQGEHRGPLAPGAHYRGELAVFGKGAAGIEPALHCGQRAQRLGLLAADQSGPGEIPVGLALAHAHQDLTVFKHLEPPVGQRALLRKKARRLAHRREVRDPVPTPCLAPLRRSSGGAFRPIRRWRHYPDHRLAPLTRSRNGSIWAIIHNALTANLAGSFLATYRAIARKYPHRKPAEILADLVASTPGEEGKWFAAAKDAELYAEAILLANRTPCDPHTLIRAARDYAEKHPAFALEAGLAALRWLAAGYGYEITGADVLAAHAYTMKAAENAGLGPEAQARMRELLESAAPGADFVTRILGRQLGIA
jgi:hypothetical protein